MKATIKVVAAAAVMACAVSAQAQVKFDANMEYDLTKVTDKSLDSGGRVELNAQARAENANGFVAGKGTILVKTDGDTAVDDAWIQFGTKMVNAKFGRFEGIDLSPVGMDTVLVHAGKYEPYRGNALRGRVGTSDGTHMALSITPSESTTIELGVLRGKEDGKAQGFRPAVSIGMGAATLRLGAERVEVKGKDGDQTGAAIGVDYKLSDSASISASFAKKEDDKGVHVNGTFGNFGVGVAYGKGDGEANEVTTFYTAYKIPFMDIKGASITPALSYSKPGQGDNVTALRVRLRYDF